MADDKLFYSISAAAALVGIEEYVIRFWEKSFPAVKPARKAGRRYFRKRDIDVLLRIKDLLYRQGFTIKGAKKALSNKKTARDFEAEEDDIPMMNITQPVFGEPHPEAEPPAPPPKRQRVLARFSTSIAPQPAPAPAPSAPFTLNRIVKKIEEIEDILK
jgi:DNA-binding transcriptional MerR regulator